jgi:hypothetical protein
MSGYIKLFRQLKEWEWYSDSNVKSLFLHCLLSANYKDKNWKGIEIKRGQFLTSLKHLADELGLSVQNIRTALEKLIKTGEVTKQPTSTYTLITVCKFDSYQCLEDDTNKQTNTPLTHDQHTTNTPLTHDQQQHNKEKNNKKDNKEEEKYIYLAEFQKLKNGDLPMKTQLDKNFHFGLFDVSWSDSFNNAILGMWRYLESKEYNPTSWGNIGTLSSQVSVIKSSLNEFSENEIIKGFDDCKFASKKSWHMYIKKEDDKPNTTDYTPPYTLPNLPTEELRLRYFVGRFEKYRKAIPGDKSYLNTKLRHKAIYEKQAEKVCYELEQKHPELTKIEMQWHVTQ